MFVKICVSGEKILKSSPFLQMTALNSNEAAVRALQLFTTHAPVCQALRVPSPPTSSTASSAPSPIPINESSSLAIAATSVSLAAPNVSAAGSDTFESSAMDHEPSSSSSSSGAIGKQPSTSNPSTKSKSSDKKLRFFNDSYVNKGNLLSWSSTSNAYDPVALNLELLTEILESCKTENKFARLRMLLWSAFSNDLSLKISFVPKKTSSLNTNTPKDVSPSCSSKIFPDDPPEITLDDSGISSKEQLRSSESDLDKDIDSAVEDDCHMACQEFVETNPDNDISAMNIAGDSSVGSLLMDVSQDSNLGTMDVTLPDKPPESSELTSFSVSTSSPAQDVVDMAGTAATNSCILSLSSNLSEIKDFSLNSSEVHDGSQIFPGCDKDTKILGLPYGLPYIESSRRNLAIGHTVLKKQFPEPNIDFEDLRKVYKLLSEIPEDEYKSALISAQTYLLNNNLVMKHKGSKSEFHKDMKIVDIFIILMENPSFISNNDYTEVILEPLCEGFTLLGTEQKAVLIVYLAKHWSNDRLQAFLAAFHHLITIKLISTESGIGSNYDG